MELLEVNITEFNKLVYPEYLRLFPKLERKPYKVLERTIIENIAKALKIVVNNKFVGFFIVNTLKNNSIVQLDYFAILPEYQSKGYGSKAINLLKEKYVNSDGIFIEIEKVGIGENEEENIIREKRSKFYERLGFYKLNFDINMYTVIYSTYLLPNTDKKDILEERIIENIFEIYNAILGEKRVKSNIKVIL